jgi:hypothetical protein
VLCGRAPLYQAMYSTIVWREVRVGCDQLGRVLGVDEPGCVPAGNQVEPGAVNLSD